MASDLTFAAAGAAKYALNRDAQKRFIMDTLTIALQDTCSLDAIEVIDYTSTLRSHNNSCFLVPDIINQFKYMSYSIFKQVLFLLL